MNISRRNTPPNVKLCLFQFWIYCPEVDRQTDGQMAPLSSMVQYRDRRVIKSLWHKKLEGQSLERMLIFLRPPEQTLQCKQRRRNVSESGTALPSPPLLSPPFPWPPLPFPIPPLPSLRSRHPLLRLGGLGSA